MGVGKLKLTIDELRNMIAFGNRAQMNGAEADTWVALKAKLMAEGQRLEAERKELPDDFNVEPINRDKAK